LEEVAAMRIAYSIALLVFVLVPLCACEGTGGVVGEARVWVSIDPVQCDGNAWDPSGLSPEKYYESLGVEVTASVTILVFDAVCTACSCPNGFREFLEIDAGSLEFMLSEGFVLTTAPGE
jgi:hypothetical protein